MAHCEAKECIEKASHVVEVYQNIPPYGVERTFVCNQHARTVNAYVRSIKA